MVGQLSLLEVQEAKSNATNTTNTNFFIQVVLNDIEQPKLPFLSMESCGVRTNLL
jgi:hypothetical protein